MKTTKRSKRHEVSPYGSVWKTLLTTIFTVFSSVLFAQPQLPFTGNVDNPVLTPGPGAWDSGVTFTPNIIFNNGTYYLFYTGSINPYTNTTAIGYATSANGFNFTKVSVLIPLFEADGTGFDAWSVNDPVISYEETTWVLYYGATPNSSDVLSKAIGKATTTELSEPWSRLDDPILEVGSPGEWDSFFIFPSCVITTEEGYSLYYWAGNNWPGGIWYIGLATSPDGLTWTKYDDPTTASHPFEESDPIIKTGSPGQWDEDALNGCVVLNTPFGFEMFYSGHNNFYYCSSIGFATSEDGIEWNKDMENNPVFTWEEDPYAFANDLNILEIPTVVVNESKYYLYYDYGPNTGEIGMATAVITDVEKQTGNQQRIPLIAYPNPLKTKVTIEFTLPESEFVTLSIYDITGKHLKTILSKKLSKGNHKTNWNAEGFNVGIYFVRLQTITSCFVQKVIILE